MRTFFITIISGIIIGVLAPSALKYISPDSKFEYIVEGPLEINAFTALKIRLSNKGTKPEKNVRLIFNTSGRFDSKKPLNEEVFVEPATCTMKYEGNQIIIYVGDLRPGETQDISILSPSIYVSKYGINEKVSGISVKSEDYLAEQIYKSDLENIFYPICFWIVILSFASLIGGGAYYDLCVPFKNKEKSLLKQLKVLREKEAKKQASAETTDQAPKNE